ncbi:MAG: potassium channel family protein [Gammaproteobacteria bacterium]
MSDTTKPDSSLVREFFATFGHILWMSKSIYFVLFGLIFLGGFIVQQVEDLAPGEGFYFAMVTGLTIGYGDIAPVTLVGRMVALCLGFIGIILTGMMVATAVFSLREAWERINPGNTELD